MKLPYHRFCFRTSPTSPFCRFLPASTATSARIGRLFEKISANSSLMSHTIFRAQNGLGLPIYIGCPFTRPILTVIRCPGRTRIRTSPCPTHLENDGWPPTELHVRFMSLLVEQARVCVRHVSPFAMNYGRSLRYLALYITEAPLQ